MQTKKFIPSEFWDYLGSSWSTFEDKDLIEQIWLSFSGITQKLNINLYQLQQSRVMDVLPPIVTEGPILYTLVFNGNKKNVILPEPGETDFKFMFNVPKWSFDIPIIEHSETGTQYTQGVDYELINNGTIKWTATIPDFDSRFPVNTLKLYVEEIRKINPVLMDVWCQFVDFKLEYLDDYNTFKEDTSDETLYTHLKYLVWALSYKQLQAPSLKNLKDLLAISRGMPFAYNAGMLTSTLDGTQYRVFIEHDGGTDEYLFPENLEPIPDGEVKKFDIIAEGVELLSYSDDPLLFDSLVNEWPEDPPDAPPFIRPENVQLIDSIIMGRLTTFAESGALDGLDISIETEFSMGNNQGFFDSQRVVDEIVEIVLPLVELGLEDEQEVEDSITETTSDPDIMEPLHDIHDMDDELNETIEPL